MYTCIHIYMKISIYTGALCTHIYVYMYIYITGGVECAFDTQRRELCLSYSALWDGVLKHLSSIHLSLASFAVLVLLVLLGLLLVVVVLLLVLAPFAWAECTMQNSRVPWEQQYESIMCYVICNLISYTV